MEQISQYIEVKEGVTYRVTDTNGDKSYEALGEATEPQTIKLANYIKEEGIEAPEEDIAHSVPPLDSFKNKESLIEYAEDFDIVLNKRKSLENMYDDLVEALA